MWAEVHGEGRSPKDGEEASGGPARLEGGGRAHWGAVGVGAGYRAPAVTGGSPALGCVTRGSAGPRSSRGRTAGPGGVSPGAGREGPGGTIPAPLPSAQLQPLPAALAPRGTLGTSPPIPEGSQGTPPPPVTLLLSPTAPGTSLRIDRRSCGRCAAGGERQHRRGRDAVLQPPPAS